MNAVVSGAPRTDETVLQAQAVRELFQSLDGEVRWVPLLPTLLVVGLWPYVSHTALLVWLAAALIVPTWRYLLVQRYKKTNPAIADAKRWAWHMCATTGADGIVWGIAGWAFLVPDALPPQLILLALLVGIPAGSIFINSWWPISLHAYSVPSLLLTATGLIVQGTPSHFALAGGLLVYLAILFQVMRNAHAASMQSLALRLENAGLVEQLRREKEISDEANLAKSRFLAAASHDLRQPLHALSLYVGALGERVRDPSVSSTMEGVHRCVEALDSLFDALLDISQLDAGAVKPSDEAVPINALFEQLDAEFAPQARAKGLEWHLARTDAVVVTDRHLFERILRNLLSNAIRYTEHGEIRLGCTSIGNQVQVEVADTGIGIPAEAHKEVFREFVQLHNSERDRRKGIGLGLSIVQRLAHLLGHPIEVRSEPGVGTSFKLTLPAGSALAMALPAHHLAPVLAPLPTRPVVVVDDEADIRDAMRVLLGGWGFQVIAVASASEAIAELGNETPLAIIADHRLAEGGDGVLAINRIREATRSSPPALVITGDTSEEPGKTIAQSGFSHLYKPVSPSRLLAFLETARLST